MSGWSRRCWRTAQLGLVAGLLATGGPGITQVQFPAPGTLPGDPQGLNRPHLPDEEPYVAREMQARQLKRLREEHQKEIFSDTDKLVQMATNLKAEIDKGDKPTLDTIKSVDEIGKLAKKVSDRIKTQ